MIDGDDMPPPLEMDVNEQGSDSSDSFDNDDISIEEEAATTCLFCDNVSPSIEVALKHLCSAHGVDFRELKHKFKMDQYSFLKLINCIRWENISGDYLKSAQKPFWDDEKYLKPKTDYESWLVYDYDEQLLPLQTEALKSVATCNEDDNDSTRKMVISLQQKIKEQSLLLEQASEDMTKMRVSFQRLLEKEDTSAKAKPTKKSDEGYFSSYSHFGIHHEMLSDIVRTTSYRDALLNNKDFISGKDVLDVGCGTGILSMFASQAGANKVVGIDNSDIVYNAMDIIRMNNFKNITLIKGRLEDTELPQKKFDIIISEWMGYFLLFEGMLDSIIYARDNHLSEGGLLMPNRCTMSILGYGSDELFQQHVGFWKNVYGFDMSNMRKDVMHEPLIDVVTSEHILTDAFVVADLNLSTVDIKYSNFTCDFNFKCKMDGNLSAFVGYFDTFFDLPTTVKFGTAPTDKPTHWKQVVFFIEQPQTVKSAEIISGKFTCRRSHSSARSLDIIIEVFGKKHTYYLD